MAKRCARTLSPLSAHTCTRRRLRRNGFRSDGCRPTPGKVRGVEALWVVDASTLPDIPSVATNVTTIVVAERIAAKHISNRHAVPRR
jgi:choline dehydrogenase-like flavoprotein